MPISATGSAVMTVVPAACEALFVAVHGTHRHVKFAISAPSQSTLVLLCIIVLVSICPSRPLIESNAPSTPARRSYRRDCFIPQTPSEQLHHQQHPPPPPHSTTSVTTHAHIPHHGRLDVRRWARRLPQRTRCRAAGLRARAFERRHRQRMDRGLWIHRSNVRMLISHLRSHRSHRQSLRSCHGCE